MVVNSRRSSLAKSSTDQAATEMDGSILGSLTATHKLARFKGEQANKSFDSTFSFDVISPLYLLADHFYGNSVY